VASRSALGLGARSWLESGVQFWIRLLLVMGSLGASAFLAPRASRTQVAALFGAGAFLVLLRWPPLGLMALVFGGMVVPFAVGTGTLSRLNVALLLLPALVALWVLEMLARRNPRLVASWSVPSLLALSVAAVLAFVAGTEPWMVFADTASLASQAGGLYIFLLSASAFLLSANQIRSVQWLQRLTWLFLALGALYLGGRLWGEMGRYTTDLFQRGADGSLFWVWLAALSFSQAMFNDKLSGLARLALMGLVSALFYVALSQGQDWTSGWFPPLVAVLATLWAGAPRLGLWVTLVGGVVVMLNWATVVDLVMVGDNVYSLDTRVAAWRVLEEVIALSPVLGLGPANYYWYTPLFSLDGFHTSFSSHNNYVDIIAQTGLLGLICFGWFVWGVARRCWRLRCLARPGFERGYGCGALGGLAGTLVAAMLGDWVLPFVYNVGFDGFRSSMLAWVFLGGMAAIEATVRGSRSVAEGIDPIRVGRTGSG